MAPKKAKLPACGFVVTLRPEDESLSIKIKKVAKGKKVTILCGVTGSRLAAVNTLKQLMGVGGEISEDSPDGIELQGDQSGRLLTILRNLGALRGESTPSESVVMKTNHGYEAFMKKSREEKTPVNVSSTDEMSKACILVHGRYWPYCNGACVFCPPLTDVFEGLDMYCSWFEPLVVDKPLVDDLKQIDQMSDKELQQALSSLGLKAEVGAACKDYERQKKLRASIPFVKPTVLDSPPVSSFPPAPARAVLRTQKSAVKFIDRPVRVILNRPPSSSSSWFVMEVTLRDPSQWMKDYEYFLVSLLRETHVDLVNHELEDSRCLSLFFGSRQSMEECHTVLSEVMPDFFDIKTTDPSPNIHDKLDAPNPEESSDNLQATKEEEENEVIDFEKLAREFGVDNEEFWETFTLLIEDSDGSSEGIERAFRAALLKVTENS